MILLSYTITEYISAAVSGICQLPAMSICALLFGGLICSFFIIQVFHAVFGPFPDKDSDEDFNKYL